MNNDWSDFCEGDSGVIFNSHIGMPITRSTNETSGVSTKRIGTNRFVGDIYKIADNKDNSAEVRLSAYALVWKITMDRFNCNDRSLTDR